MKKFTQVVTRSSQNNVSDIHIIGGQPLVYRKNGKLVFDNRSIWSHSDVDAVLEAFLNPNDRTILDTRLSVDFAVTIRGIRIRINAFHSMAGFGMAIRLLPGQAPTIQQLNLHPSLKEYCKVKDGLILICGSTGSGKSGTIAAMIEEINRTTASRIITLEDPVEYRFISKKSFITQRELGTHFPSFEQGLLDILREDADVIVVGELRDPDTMRLALHAAESGHVVISTAHASSSEDALHRISNSFPAEAQAMVRNQLSSTLSLLIVQKLVLNKSLNFRLPVLSILRVNPAVKNIIRDDKAAQLKGVMETSHREGMYTMDQYEDYLKTRTDLTPPSLVFKGSKELPPISESAAGVRIKVNASSPGVQSHPSKPRPLEKVKRQSSPETARLATGGYGRPDSPGQQYVIEEETSMEDILKSMKEL